MGKRLVMPRSEITIQLSMFAPLTDVKALKVSGIQMSDYTIQKT